MQKAEALKMEAIDHKNARIPVCREDLAKRNELVIEYAPLVKRVAYRIIARLPETIQIEDLISIGTLGLMDAIQKYDPDKGKGFRAYAELRINGAILDELRGYDNLSRVNRRRANKMNKAVRELENRLGRAPRDEEVAEEMGLDLDEYYSVRAATRSLVFLDIDDSSNGNSNEPAKPMEGGDPETHFEPFQSLADKSMKECLTQALEKLPEKLKLVLSLYYFSELNYKEIGEVLDLSESRISQLHSKAIEKLRRTFQSQEAL